MSKSEQYSGIFSSGHSYSSTMYPELLSSTYSFCCSHYCIHCHKAAKAVQANIEFYGDYKTTGYRCTCDAAINEIAELLAYEIGDFKFIKPMETYSIGKDRYLKLIGNLEEDRLPINSKIDVELPSVIYSKKHSEYLPRFLSNNSYEIKSFLNNSCLIDRELAKLMSAVIIKAKELAKEELAYHEKSIETLNDIELYFSR